MTGGGTTRTHVAMGTLGTTPAELVLRDHPECEKCTWTPRMLGGDRMDNGQFPHKWHLKYINTSCIKHSPALSRFA